MYQGITVLAMVSALQRHIDEYALEVQLRECLVHARKAVTMVNCVW